MRTFRKFSIWKGQNGEEECGGMFEWSLLNEWDLYKNFDRNLKFKARKEMPRSNYLPSKFAEIFVIKIKAIKICTSTLHFGSML